MKLYCIGRARRVQSSDVSIDMYRCQVVWQSLAGSICSENIVTSLSDVNLSLEFTAGKVKRQESATHTNFVLKIDSFFSFSLVIRFQCICMHYVFMCIINDFVVRRRYKAPSILCQVWLLCCRFLQYQISDFKNRICVHDSVILLPFQTFLSFLQSRSSFF